MAAHGPSTVAAILVAGGSGQRLGAAMPKAFCEVDGQTLLELAAWRFAAHPEVGALVVVAPATHLDEAEVVVASVLAAAGAMDDRFAQAGLPGRVREPVRTAVVAGGVTRQASVQAGLAALDADVEYVLVHDVARPFVPKNVITAVLAELADGADAAIPVVPVHDTIRRVDDAGNFAGVVDRNELVAVQTPQGFRRTALFEAHAAGERLEVTDDAALVEAMGGTVAAVPGSDQSFKITRPWDLTVAESLVEAMAFDG